MSACKWMADMLLTMFTVYLFFLYFGMFFERRKKNIRVLLGVIVLVLWQVGIPEVINELPKAWNIGTTVGLALFVVANVFEGKAWMKSFFAVTFAAIWMLAEMLIGSVLMIYGESIVERQIFGAFASRFLFFLIILALRKVFTNEKVTGLPTGYSILIIFIPTGSIYIMNAVFVLAYRTDWEYAEGYSLVSGLILLFINVLIFYIYIRLADDLRIRRMNLVYEQQLDLCARHQEERELSVLQMRDVRHGMRNHLLSILAYAERGEGEAYPVCNRYNRGWQAETVRRDQYREYRDRFPGRILEEKSRRCGDRISDGSQHPDGDAVPGSGYKPDHGKPVGKCSGRRREGRRPEVHTAKDEI